MAKLVLETSTHGFQQFHKIDQLPVRVGRAYDNDIILSDRSISPYHLEITENEAGEIEVTNLSKENGTRFKRKLMGNDPEVVKFPSSLLIGHSKLRILSSDTPVEPTVIRDCSGFFCLFSSPFWAVILVGLTIATFWLDSYLNSPITRDIGYHLATSFQHILIMVLFFLITAGISRLATHRWILIPSVTVASLLFLIPKLIEHAGHFLNYYFNTDGIRDFALDINNVALLPLLLTIFMVRVAHTKILAAIGVALLVSSPLLFFQVKDFIRSSTGSKFTPLPKYSKTLSAYDIRMNQSGSPKSFVDIASKNVTKQVLIDLENYEKEEKKEDPIKK